MEIGIKAVDGEGGVGHMEIEAAHDALEWLQEQLDAIS
jgi:hypothetical protein